MGPRGRCRLARLPEGQLGSLGRQEKPGLSPWDVETGEMLAPPVPSWNSLGRWEGIKTEDGSLEGRTDSRSRASGPKAEAGRLLSRPPTLEE